MVCFIASSLNYLLIWGVGGGEEEESGDAHWSLLVQIELEWFNL